MIDSDQFLERVVLPAQIVGVFAIAVLVCGALILWATG